MHSPEAGIHFSSHITQQDLIKLAVNCTLQGDFIGGRGDPFLAPPLQSNKTQRKAPIQQKSQLPVVELFFCDALLTSKVKNKNKNQHNRPQRVMCEWDHKPSCPPYPGLLDRTEKKVRDLLGAGCCVFPTHTVMEKGWVCGHGRGMHDCFQCAWVPSPTSTDGINSNQR